MAKKKKKKKDRKKIDFSEMLEKHPEFDGVINPQSWEHIGFSDENTVGALKKLWGDNIKANVKNGLYKKHGMMNKDCNGIGKNKAVIGVGAGQCFNKNKDVLKRVSDVDGVRDWKDRDFIIIASNHQYKPLLDMGIIPDFVILADASDVVMDQLTKDVPTSGKNTVLLAGLICDPGVLETWSKQGKDIRFYMSRTEGLDTVFKEATGKSSETHKIIQGGNVINSLWSISLKHFNSNVYFAVGNDLSYPLQDDIEDQRNGYYADGDYSSNLANKRDEAQGRKKWLGFSIKRKPYNIGGSPYNIELTPVGTSSTLWVYKTWIESNVLANAKTEGLSYHYYNCTEGGIAGVMCKDMDDETLRNDDNWFLLDKVCKRWHTTLLEDAVDIFIKAKEKLLWPGMTQLGVQGVAGLGQTPTRGIVSPAMAS